MQIMQKSHPKSRIEYCAPNSPYAKKILDDKDNLILQIMALGNEWIAAEVIRAEDYKPEPEKPPETPYPVGVIIANGMAQISMSNGRICCSRYEWGEQYAEPVPAQSEIDAEDGKQ